jgi:hypothetical protein
MKEEKSCKDVKMYKESERGRGNINESSGKREIENKGMKGRRAGRR